MNVEPLKRCICGAEVDQDECPYPSGRRTSVDGRALYVVNCTNNECGWQCLGWGKDGARKAWNTRPDHYPEAGKMGEERARLDWLERHVVEVREPLRHGSAHMFYATQVNDEGELYRSNLRFRVDAARAGERG